MPVAGGAGSGETKRRCLVRVRGIVQGVGFRPFIYNLAGRYGLSGRVQNTPDGVLIDIEGAPEAVSALADAIRTNPPPLAQITDIELAAAPAAGYTDFAIVPSAGDAPKDVLIAPDVATCADCRADLMDPGNRRSRYPFTNCTNCGPRYTIIRDVPYDRAATSMRGFTLCPDCQAEYDDPADRRFHAQPNACPVCGPQVRVWDRDGREIDGDWEVLVRDLLRAGQIGAIKGLGGFHLACEALNPAAVAELRRRKQRPAKPLAVMARDLGWIRQWCQVSEREATILTSPAAPIVLLDLLQQTPATEILAPGLSRLGVFLPYTPLHHRLFAGDLSALVLTSGNRRSLPLARTNAAALAELGDVADFFVVHDREIVNRCDDSVLRVVGDREYFYRRSRGYTPRPIVLSAPAPAPVLAVGADMKNTFCIIRGSNAFPGPHIGDLSNRETEEHFLAALAAYRRILGVEPEIVACDLHPDYASTRLAEALSPRRLYRVQHHHAHLASCMAEQGLTGPVLGVICDGTGYGTDGTLWGMEVLTGDYTDFTREYHLSPLPLPGGETAIRQPWRMAVSALVRCRPEQAEELARRLFPERMAEIPAVIAQCRSGFNSPLTSGCGRLFDAVSAILGICRETSYEGQAAIELGELAGNGGEPYPYGLTASEMDPAPLLRAVVDDCLEGVSRAVIAGRFHATLVRMLSEAALLSARRRGLSRVVLSGGVFQNEFLLTGLSSALAAAGLTVYRHRLVPPGDGGIALGQAAIAAAREQAGRWPDEPAER